MLHQNLSVHKECFSSVCACVHAHARTSCWIQLSRAEWLLWLKCCYFLRSVHTNSGIAVWNMAQYLASVCITFHPLCSACRKALCSRCSVCTSAHASDIDSYDSDACAMVQLVVTLWCVCMHTCVPQNRCAYIFLFYLKERWSVSCSNFSALWPISMTTGSCTGISKHPTCCWVIKAF